MPELDRHAPLAPLDVAACIEAHLRATHADLLVYGSLDLLQAKRSLRTPCAVVVPVADELEQVESHDPDERVVLRMLSTVAVVVGVGAPNDPGGKSGKAAAAFLRLLAPIRASLLGWPPDGGRRFPTHPPAADNPAVPREEWPLSQGRTEPLVWTRGRLLLIEDGRAWWQDEYRTRWLVAGARNAEPDGLFGDVDRVCATVEAPRGSEREGPYPLVGAP